MLNKEHSTLEGIQKIVNIKASLKLGLSNDLKKAFPKTIPKKNWKVVLKIIQYTIIYIRNE
jgi:hypothetical protein